MFIQFISYNYLRPVEVCRLKIGNLDIEGKKLFVIAKNKAVKVKIIPQKIIDLLSDLSKYNPEHFLFTPDCYGLEWNILENNKRDYFSKRFNVVVKNNTLLKTSCCNLSKSQQLSDYSFIFVMFGVYPEH